jgi:signal transduction histidine kinase
LRVTVDELETAQAIKDEFLALVSHELRTPLTSIRGYAELLQDEELADAQREYVNVIDRNAGRLVGLVEDLLLMAQIQSGGVPLELGDVLLNELIARSGEAAKPFAASKQITLDIDVELGIATQGDPVRLGQVLDNLVSNAIKYTPDSGRVCITMTRTGETATIAVRDSGIGIPLEEQDQMFSRFFRASNARVSGIDGSGLGLAITRGIVEAHGGTIGFESVVGAGTTFRITLPHAHGCGLESAA